MNCPKCNLKVKEQVEKCPRCGLTRSDFIISSLEKQEGGGGNSSHD